MKSFFNNILRNYLLVISIVLIVEAVPREPCFTYEDCNPIISANDNTHEYCNVKKTATEGICECENGYFTVDLEDGSQQCKKLTMSYGDPCHKDADCYPLAHPEFTVCELDGGDEGFRRCVCHGKTVFIPMADHPHGRCLEKVENFEFPCLEDEQCQSEDMKCVENENAGHKTCMCQHSVPSEHKFACLPLAQRVGNECVEDIQCLHLGDSPDFISCRTDGGSTGSCECNKQLSVPSSTNSRCIALRSFNETCREDLQCSSVVENSLCLRLSPNDESRVCQCWPGFVFSNVDGPECLPTRDFNEDCKVHNQCPEGQGVVCDEVCKCDTNFVLVGNRCLRLAENLGDECEEIVQCSNLPDSQCLENESGDYTCQCNPNSHVSNPDDFGDQSCYPIWEGIEDTCVINMQCKVTLGEPSECLNTQCRCITGAYLAEDGKCYLPVSLDFPCTNDYECKGQNEFSYCPEESSRCDCIPEALKFNKRCYEDKSLGDPCEFDEECEVPLGPYSLCHIREGKCQCKSSYVPAEDGKSCIFQINGSNRCNGVNLFIFVLLVVRTLFCQL